MTVSFSRRIFHDGERFGQDFVELLFDLLVDAFGDLVDLLRNLLFLFECGFGAFQLCFQGDDALLVGGDEIGNLLHQRLAPAAEFVVRKCGDGGVDLLDFVDIGFDGLAVFVRLRTEQEFDYTGYNIHKCLVVNSVMLIKSYKDNFFLPKKRMPSMKNGFSAYKKPSETSLRRPIQCM